MSVAGSQQVDNDGGVSWRCCKLGLWILMGKWVEDVGNWDGG